MVLFTNGSAAFSSDSLDTWACGASLCSWGFHVLSREREGVSFVYTASKNKIMYIYIFAITVYQCNEKTGVIIEY